MYVNGVEYQTATLQYIKQLIRIWWFHWKICQCDPKKGWGWGWGWGCLVWTKLINLNKGGGGVASTKILQNLPSKRSYEHQGPIQNFINKKAQASYPSVHQWILYKAGDKSRFVWTHDPLFFFKYCFTSTETVRLFQGQGAQDGHLDFHTAPELWDPLSAD